MVSSISNKVVNCLLQHAVIERSRKEIYVYGAELLISDLLNFSLIMLMGIWFHQIGTSILFLLCFVPTRRFCGGYHASTHFGCRCAMILTFAMLVFLSALFPQNYALLVVLMNLASAGVITYLAPIENPNKPISKAVFKRNRQRAIAMALLMGVVSAALYSCGWRGGIVISFTLHIIAMLMIIEIQKRKGEESC